MTLMNRNPSEPILAEAALHLASSYDENDSSSTNTKKDPTSSVEDKNTITLQQDQVASSSEKDKVSTSSQEETESIAEDEDPTAKVFNVGRRRVQFWKKTMDELIKMVQQGFVNMGENGELAFQTWIMGVVISLPQSNNGQKIVIHYPEHMMKKPVVLTTRKLFSDSFYLHFFFENLFTDDLWSELRSKLPKSMSNALIMFTHFAKVDYDLSPKVLLELLHRRVAIVAKNNQRGFDYIIPILLPNGKGEYEFHERYVSAIVIQVKNRDAGLNRHDAFEKMRDSFCGIGFTNDYFTLYVNVQSSFHDDRDEASKDTLYEFSKWPKVQKRKRGTDQSPAPPTAYQLALLGFSKTRLTGDLLNRVLELAMCNNSYLPLLSNPRHQTNCEGIIVPASSRTFVSTLENDFAVKKQQVIGSILL